MDVSRGSNDEQTALWNGSAGQSWIEAQELLDGMFQPLEELLVQVVAAHTGAAAPLAVVDVGCGTGSTTLAIQRQLGATGRCVGIDISQPMIELARVRAERERSPASFLCADAELHAFERQRFDLLVSRFGVMFFNDSVQALANLRQAARPGAELYFLVWRSPAENPFMTAAEQAAAPLLPNIPARNPDAPGQFAFADPSRVTRLLEQSGWVNGTVRPLDVECTFPEQELTRYVTRLGPLGRVLRDADEATKAQALAVVKPAFAPFIQGAAVRFRAACWQISARAPA